MTTNVSLNTQGAVTTLVLTGGAPGQGVPVGGTAGHALHKRTGTSFDTEWRDPSVRDSFQLNTGAGATADVAGKMVWNAAEGTMDLCLNANVTLQVGQEHNKLCRNVSGVSITDGAVVRVVGSSGTHLTVALADASDESTSAGTYGVVTETIANNASGYVTLFGVVRGINTSGIPEGSLLYLSETAGGFTHIAPAPPAHRVIVGYCIKSSAGAGEIYVKVDNGYELNELHDVLFTSLADGDFVRRDAAAGLWRNSKSVMTTVPANAGAAGVAGQIAADASYLYVCVATNTWRRVAISTW
jgi:hypothetical protein